MVVLRVQAFEQLAKSQIVTGPDVALAMHCHLKRGHFQFAIGLLQQHEDKWLHMEHSQQQMLFDDVLAANTRGCDALEVDLIISEDEGYRLALHTSHLVQGLDVLKQVGGVICLGDSDLERHGTCAWRMLVRFAAISASPISTLYPGAKTIRLYFWSPNAD